ncbi:sulfurtransferase [uncultured Corynebacterium sp.]|uniref:sulfurtransferase n=1 Tax=uncultured Corynebacterium sp. TaxID=159447 RepID=UPI0025EC76E6|nr:sulfurtransferase [uncultured Corynebacterium sp.]
MTVSISPSELAESIHTGEKNTVLAAFWAPIEGAGQTLFRSEHIPNSLFCDPAMELAGLPSSSDGRNPLPPVRLLTQAFRRWGLNTDRKVVVYDQGRGLYAARAWWILKWAGIPEVRILDGGFRNWEDGDHGHAGGPGNFPHFCNVRPNPGQMPVATMEDVKKHTGILIDARDSARFAGHRELLDLKAGHIPGAVNVPARNLLNEDHTFKAPEEIREILSLAGVTSGDDVIVYSGSGNHSAQVLAAMEQAGLTGAAHYLGGWSQWSANATNPVERSA